LAILICFKRKSSASCAAFCALSANNSFFLINNSSTRFFVVDLSLSGLDIHVLKGSAVLIDDNSVANISGYSV